MSYGVPAISSERKTCSLTEKKETRKSTLEWRNRIKQFNTVTPLQLLSYISFNSQLYCMIKLSLLILTLISLKFVSFSSLIISVIFLSSQLDVSSERGMKKII